MSDEKKISESGLSDEDQAALAMLSLGELHILSRLLEIHPSDEAWDFFEVIRSERKDAEIPTYHFSNSDPYAERDPLPSDHEDHKTRVGEDGDLRVQNVSAYFLPKIKIMQEIGGTVYSVTGSYDGMALLDRKLERIMERNATDAEAEE